MRKNILLNIVHANETFLEVEGWEIEHSDKTNPPYLHVCINFALVAAIRVVFVLRILSLCKVIPMFCSFCILKFKDTVLNAMAGVKIDRLNLVTKVTVITAYSTKREDLSLPQSSQVSKLLPEFPKVYILKLLFKA